MVQDISKIQYKRMTETPILLVFSYFFGLRGIQFSQMTADILAAMVTLPMMVKYLRSLPADGEGKE